MLHEPDGAFSSLDGTQLKKPAYARKPANLPPGSPIELIKREFARRVSERMKSKGWNHSELARQMARLSSKGVFDRSSISLYVNAKSLPRQEQLALLARALDCESEDLLPPQAYTDAERAEGANFRDLGGGMVMVNINDTMSWKKATKIMAILHGDDD